MKVIRILLTLCLIPLLTLFGACDREKDLFAPFRGAYRADIAGEMNGVPFGAVLEADALNGDGVRTLTLTFYAPASLSGTVVTQSPAGELSLAVGDLSVVGISAEGFLPLLHLLPVGGEVTEVSLDEAGHSVVTGEGFTLTLQEDGTPIAATNATVSATIVLFEMLETP